MRRVLSLALLAWLLLPASAPAATPKPFGSLDCPEQEGVRFCQGEVPTFDGVPIDLNVTLPQAGDGPFPLIVLAHGWGGQKAGLTGNPSGASKPWADRGFAVLALTSRGFNGSCGTPQNRLDPGCLQGWVRLDDTRYEIRDVQHFAGLLVDDGLVDPARIGAHGGSYGGGVSFALSMLRDRVMNADGTYGPWVSPKGTPIRLAAAAPFIPWTDLVYALTPNGRNLDYVMPRPDDSRVPAGVLKTSFVAGLYGLGNTAGFYAPPGADSQADLTSWYARLNAGEPYDDDPTVKAIADQIYDFHTSIGIERSREPAPTFVASGWTDDLFPPDEALRMRNVFASQFPAVPFAMMFFDFGHQRGAQKPADMTRYRAHVVDWMERYVKGDGSVSVVTGVETLTQTCPSDDDTPSGGPFNAPSWPEIHPGEVRFTEAAEKTFSSAGGDPSVAAAIDPIGGGGDPCAATASGDEADTANYRLPPAAGNGYTLMGGATVIADIATTGTFPQINARLWDVGPDGRQTLVARTVYRPDESGKQVFQLHPNGWHFAAEHVPKLQLLGRDAPYARASNGTFSVTVSNLELRLPVAERPGGLIREPAPAVLRPGDTPAPGVGRSTVLGGTSTPRPDRRRRRVRLRLVTGCRTVRLRGRDVRRVRRLVVRQRGMRRHADRRRPFRVRLGGQGRRVRAVAVLRGGRRVKLRATMPRRCLRR